MTMPCGYVCDNKTSEGYCKTTACINPSVRMAECWSVHGEDKKDDTAAIHYKVITEVESEATIADIAIEGEKVFQVCKDGNWEIERIFTEYKSPCDKMVVVMSRKEKKNDDV